MSARNSFLRRSSLRLHHDVDRQVAARLAQAVGDGGDVVAAGRRGCRPRLRRTAIAPGRARAEWRARRRPPCYRARGRRDCRSAWRRETCEVSSHPENDKAVLIAGPTASGKSALALELARSDRRRRHQCRFHAGLSRPARHHGAADAGGGGARAAPALRPCRCRGEFLRRRMGGRCRDGAGGSARAKPPADFRRRLRPLFQGADARPVGGAADSGRRSAKACARGWSATASRRCMPNWRSAIRRPPNA